MIIGIIVQKVKLGVLTSFLGKMIIVGFVSKKFVRVRILVFRIVILSVQQVKLCVIMNLLKLSIVETIVTKFDQRVEESLAAHGNGSDSSGDDGEAKATSSSSPFMKAIMTFATIIGLVVIDFI